ncbi:MAG: hypothetical protein Q7S65_03305 [Nanoarchaeota archaeon]|nr:hypothetical protein [Nanoarchaeota archaeon]
MKKGNIFVIEFLVGSLLLLSYLIYSQQFTREPLDLSDTIGSYAKESLDLIKSTPTQNFGNVTIDAIPDSLYCPKCMLSEQLAILLLRGEDAAAANATNQTLTYAIPQELGYSIALSGQGLKKEVIVQDSAQSDTLIAASTLVSGLNGTTRDVYVFQLRVWG